MPRKMKAAAADHVSLDNQLMIVSSAASPKRARWANNPVPSNRPLPVRSPPKAAVAELDDLANFIQMMREAKASAPTVASGSGHNELVTHLNYARPLASSKKAAAADHNFSDNQPALVSAAASLSTNASGDDRWERAKQLVLAAPLATNAAADQEDLDTHTAGVSGGNSKAGEEDQRSPVAQRWYVSPLAPIIREIREWHRQRVFAMEQRKRSNLALGAYLRTQLGWSRALPKAEANAIAVRAKNLMELGDKVVKGKETGVGNSDWARLGVVIVPSLLSRAPWDDLESASTKEMERLAKSLPVWAEFGEGIKGFGARSLAVIVGEAGDLTGYANPGKLWKRMGLAVMDGVRQGGLRKTAGAEAWIAHGYNAKRRSFMFVIGDVLVKNQSFYREVYLARKEYERAKAIARGLQVVPAAKIPAKRKDEFMSDGHVHRRAQRYMEKRLLKDLWRAWRRAFNDAPPLDGLPAANSKVEVE